MRSHPPLGNCTRILKLFLFLNLDQKQKSSRLNGKYHCLKNGCSGYGRPSSEYGSPSSEYGSPSGVSPSSNLLPPILSTRESDLLPPILSSKPFPRDSLPPAPPSSSYLPPSSGTQQDPTHTQCCSHLLITTRGRAFETQSSKTGDSFPPHHCFSIQDSTSWWPTLCPPSIASPLGQTTSLLGETDGKVGWTPYTYNTNNPKCDTDIKGWLVGPDTSRGVGGLASLSSSPCPHTNSPWSFYNKEGGFTVDSEIDVRLTNVP